MPIFIGTLHTFVYFNDLISPAIHDYLQKGFEYSGKVQPLWDGWGIANFMMGISFIVIGLLNISSLRKLSKTDYPPILSILAMMFYLCGVIYVGVQYQQNMQLYGGIISGALILICLTLSVNGQKQKS